MFRVYFPVDFWVIFELPHLANDEDVGKPGGEAVACAILDVHHVERSRVTLPVGDHTNTPQVSTAGHHAKVTWREREEARKSFKSIREDKMLVVYLKRAADLAVRGTHQYQT